MTINPNKKYKFVDKDLVNGFVVLTGKELNAILEKSYKEHMDKKKWNIKKPMNQLIKKLVTERLNFSVKLQKLGKLWRLKSYEKTN
mgnify:CR=1 FL=1